MLILIFSNRKNSKAKVSCVECTLYGWHSVSFAVEIEIFQTPYMASLAVLDFRKNNTYTTSRSTARWIGHRYNHEMKEILVDSDDELIRWTILSRQYLHDMINTHKKTTTIMTWGKHQQILQNNDYITTRKRSRRRFYLTGRHSQSPKRPLMRRPSRRAECADEKSKAVCDKERCCDNGRRAVRVCFTTTSSDVLKNISRKECART